MNLIPNPLLNSVMDIMKMEKHVNNNLQNFPLKVGNDLTSNGVTINGNNQTNANANFPIEALLSAAVSSTTNRNVNANNLGNAGLPLGAQVFTIPTSLATFPNSDQIPVFINSLGQVVLANTGNILANSLASLASTLTSIQQLSMNGRDNNNSNTTNTTTITNGNNGTTPQNSVSNNVNTNNNNQLSGGILDHMMQQYQQLQLLKTAISGATGNTPISQLPPPLLLPQQTWSNTTNTTTATTTSSNNINSSSTSSSDTNLTTTSAISSILPPGTNPLLSSCLLPLIPLPDPSLWLSQNADSKLSTLNTNLSPIIALQHLQQQQQQATTLHNTSQSCTNTVSVNTTSSFILNNNNNNNNNNSNNSSNNCNNPPIDYRTIHNKSPSASSSISSKSVGNKICQLIDVTGDFILSQDDTSLSDKIRKNCIHDDSSNHSLDTNNNNQQQSSGIATSTSNTTATTTTSATSITNSNNTSRSMLLSQSEFLLQQQSQSQSQNSNIMVDGVDLGEMREFARQFKVRRLSLGLTQTQVGHALTAAEGPAYSQSAICRFEKLDITPKSAQKIKPVLEKWIKETEEKFSMAAVAVSMASSGGGSVNNNNPISMVITDHYTNSQNPIINNSTTNTTMNGGVINTTGGGGGGSSLNLSSNNNNIGNIANVMVVSNTSGGASCCNDDGQGSTDLNKKRKRRTSFTPQALELLNNYFEKKSHPTGSEMRSLAQELNYDREVIRVWFCNKRQALKNTVKRFKQHHHHHHHHTQQQQQQQQQQQHSLSSTSSSLPPTASSLSLQPHQTQTHTDDIIHYQNMSNCDEDDDDDDDGVMTNVEDDDDIGCGGGGDNNEDGADNINHTFLPQQQNNDNNINVQFLNSDSLYERKHSITNNPDDNNNSLPDMLSAPSASIQHSTNPDHSLDNSLSNQNNIPIIIDSQSTPISLVVTPTQSTNIFDQTDIAPPLLLETVQDNLS